MKSIKIFLAIGLTIGCLLSVEKLDAFYKDSLGIIRPIKGDKLRIKFSVDGYGPWRLQVTNDGHIKFLTDPFGEEQSIFTVKDVTTFRLPPNNKPSEYFVLESCNNKELKLIPDTKGYRLEESSETNKKNAQNAYFRFGETYDNNVKVSCIPNGKIEKKSKMLKGKMVDIPIQYYLFIQGTNYDDDREDAIVCEGDKGNRIFANTYFSIVATTEETKQPQNTDLTNLKASQQENNKTLTQSKEQKTTKKTSTPASKQSGATRANVSRQSVRKAK